MAKGKNVLTTGDVAKICNVAPRTVSKWFDNGQLKGYRIPGSKDRRIPVSELIRFMKLHNMPTDALAPAKLRVLLVDSNSDGAATLAQNLKSKVDYEVHIAASDFQAGLAVQKFSPHVVIINLLAERIDAAEICRSIREDEDMQTTKVIALAEGLRQAESAALQRKGFDACISRCTDPAEIVKKVEEVTAIIY